MGKLIVFVLGLAVIVGGVWWALKSTEVQGSSVEAEASAPRRQLDNVREAAKRIEQEDQRRLDDMEKATAQ